jgi:CBS domain-containing protein
MKTTVRDMLKAKPGGAWSIGPGASVLDALRLMEEKDVGALLVVEGGRLEGIFSERDYARKGILRGRASKDTPVRDVMTEKVFYITPERRVEECLALMTDKRVRHLPVLEEGRILGVVSIGDAGKAMIADLEFAVQSLESYITGGR